MKILFIDTQWSGHHKKYYHCLIKHLPTTQVVGVFPSDAPDDETIKYRVSGHSSKIGLISYIKWLFSIRKIVNREKPDIIHFLYADYFYRFFGAFLGVFRKYRVVATFHHVKRSPLRNISIKHICHNVTCCVVHTASLYSTLRNSGIDNVQQVEYPVFFEQSYKGELSEDFSKVKVQGRKILLAIGATRRDKGLDILLQALRNVREDYHLIIAGAEAEIERSEIEKLISTYSEKVTLYLQFLTDAELVGLINLSDIIVLPYRKVFDGSSGPLAEGVYWGKCILGPSHGSLGKMILDNKLGYIFESENVASLSGVLNEVLQKKFTITEQYLAYQKKLKPDTFAEQYVELYVEQEE